MDTLVLITSQYPFGNGEPFLETELPIISTAFRKIIIIAQNTSEKNQRYIHENVIIFRYNTATSILGWLYMPLLCMANSTEIRKLIREEIKFRKGISFNLKINDILQLLKKIIKAIQLKQFISEKLNEMKINESIVFYSYWLKTGAHAISLLNYTRSIKIARAHGSDLYEEKNTTGYLPLMKFAAMNLDSIFFISKHGKNYFEERIRLKSPYFLVSYLGVSKPPTNFRKNVTDKFVMVSCSNLIPLKRIDLIIKALKKIKTKKEILWLHFGDGVLRNELEALAGMLLIPMKNVSYRFMGFYPNNELLNYYAMNHVDLFINTSYAEGIPVSIMEAQSFGIPVIATDTGGVKELVTSETGSILPVEFQLDELVDKIEYYSEMNEEEKKRISSAAMKNWKKNFDAQSNYADFIQSVSSIFAASKRNTTY